MKAEEKKSDQKASIGTTASNWQRERANAYSEAKREELLNRGLARIYGASKSAKAPIRRRFEPGIVGMPSLADLDRGAVRNR